MELGLGNAIDEEQKVVMVSLDGELISGIKIFKKGKTM